LISFRVYHKLFPLKQDKLSKEIAIYAAKKMIEKETLKKEVPVPT